jgi:hypothetical protein
MPTLNGTSPGQSKAEKLRVVIQNCFRYFAPTIRQINAEERLYPFYLS